MFACRVSRCLNVHIVQTNTYAFKNRMFIRSMREVKRKLLIEIAFDLSLNKMWVTLIRMSLMSLITAITETTRKEGITKAMLTMATKRF